MNTHFAPMGGGLDLDMETGLPSVPEAIARQARQEEQKHRRIERHSALIADLAGSGGAVLQHIATRLAARIDQLIADDPEAAAYVALLRDVHRELRVGERLVQDEMNELLRKDIASE